MWAVLHPACSCLLIVWLTGVLQTLHLHTVYCCQKTVDRQESILWGCRPCLTLSPTLNPSIYTNTHEHTPLCLVLLQFEFELAVARMVLGPDADVLGGLLANSTGWLGASDETHCGKMATLKVCRFSHSRFRFCHGVREGVSNSWCADPMGSCTAWCSANSTSRQGCKHVV